MIVVLSPTVSTSTAWLRAPAEATTSPSGRTTPEIAVDGRDDHPAPGLERPQPADLELLVELARSWLNIALLVCTVTSSAPRATWPPIPSS